MKELFLKKPVALAAIFVILCLIGFALLSRGGLLTPKTKIIDVSPKPQDNYVSLLPAITITFNQPVSPAQVSLSSTPSFSMYQLEGDFPPNQLKYQPNELLARKTSYKITLRFKDGGEYSWGFTTSDTETGAVPGWEENSEKALEDFFKDYPPEEVKIMTALLSKMPYFASDFWVEYTTRTNTFFVHVCQEPYDKTRDRAEGWLNEQGLSRLSKLAPKVDWLMGCQPPSRARSAP